MLSINSVTEMSNSILQDTTLFAKEVYEVVAQIPAGKVFTYGMIARLVGCPQNSRLVGTVLKNTPQDLHLPTWRVVNSQGRTVPAWTEQQELLEAEGVGFKNNGHVEIEKFLWKPFDEF